jgi:hypothetical protein
MGNPNPNEKTRFSHDKQPENKGRKRSIFGKLAKENDLSLDDIRKIYKNILTTDYDKLEELKEKYPLAFVRVTIDVFKQEVFGTLSGRSFRIQKKVDEEVEEKIVQERIKSYDLTKYMLDRIFGTPTKNEAIEHSGNVSIGLPPEPEDANFENID